MDGLADTLLIKLNYKFSIAYARKHPNSYLGADKAALLLCIFRKCISVRHSELEYQCEFRYSGKSVDLIDVYELIHV